MTSLSEKLADLSVRTKAAEDRVAKARTDTHERIEQQREKVRGEAEQALGKVKQQFEDGKGENRAYFQSLRAKVDADFEQMKRDATATKDKFETWQSGNYASDKESEAIATIDYATAAVAIAELQTLDAIAARARSDGKAEQSERSSTMA